jgi:hypothetical protein
MLINGRTLPLMRVRMVLIRFIKRRLLFWLSGALLHRAKGQKDTLSYRRLTNGRQNVRVLAVFPFWLAC